MKKYLYLILFFLICVPAIAGTINSYTLKSPPDDADTIVIYDSDDGSTKKIEVGDISGSGTGINWSSYSDLTSLSAANEFIVNSSGTSKSINWENLDRLKDASLSIFNVKKYGATGDGTTNDTSSIQAAFDAAHASGGGIVYIPAGTYSTGKITFYSDTSIDAPNQNSTILKARTGTTDVLYYSDLSIVTSVYMNQFIRNIQIDGNSVAGINGLTAIRSPHHHYNNLYIHHCNIGFNGGGDWYGSIENSLFRFNEIGVSLDLATTSGSVVHLPQAITLFNTHVKDNTSFGLLINQGASIYLDHFGSERNGTSGNATTAGIKLTNFNADVGSGDIGIVMRDSWSESNYGRADIWIDTPANSGTLPLIIEATQFFEFVPSGTHATNYIYAPSSLVDVRLSNSTFSNDGAPTNLNIGGTFYSFQNNLQGTVNTGTGQTVTRVQIVNNDLIFNTGGNVGINTTSPYFPIDFGSANGSTRATLVQPSEAGLLINSTIASALAVVNKTTGSSTQGGSIVVGSMDGALRADGDRLGAFNFIGSTGASSGAFSSRIQAFADGGWTLGTSFPSKITFDTVPSGSTTRTERMVIRANGNVGIGTSGPVQKLQVVGTVSATSFVGDGSALTGVGSSGWVDGGTNIYASPTTDNVAIGTTTPTQKLTVVGTVSATAFVGDGSGLTGLPSGGGWSDGGTNVYTSTTTDTVGIGTTTPSTTLEIVKQGSSAPLMVSSTATGDGNILIITSAGNVGIGTLLPRGPLDLGPTGTIYAQTIAGPTGPTILGTSNNVGIGTITAGSLLTVGSTGQVTVSSAGAVTTSSTVSVADDAYAAGWNGSTAVPTKNAVYDKIETLGSGGWTDGGTNVYTTTTSDNVGIGTTSPGRSLQIYGSPEDSLVGISLYHAGTGGRDWVIGSSDNTNTIGGGKFSIFDNTSFEHRFTINSNGNVGIGSTSPNASLDIRNTTSSIGWTVQTAANQACNTTCTSGCVYGQDTGTSNGPIVNCSDASADRCLCAGSN